MDKEIELKGVLRNLVDKITWKIYDDHIDEYRGRVCVVKQNNEIKVTHWGGFSSVAKFLEVTDYVGIEHEETVREEWNEK